jgi:uncharacterized protein YprB with RNaseH-like and TPR domain
LDRLRRLHGLRPQPHTEPDLPEPVTRSAPPKNRRLDTLVPGMEVETEHGSCYVVTARYPLETMRGQRCIHELLSRTPQTLASLYPSAALDGAADFSRIAFIDTETTGLGGGAGVYAFMVGVGTFEDERESGSDYSRSPIPSPRSPVPTHFVIRQFFMRHPGEELALLTALAELLGDRIGLVTFNGRSFDLPLLRGRYKLNRHYLNVDAPDALWKDGAPHLDLLHPARRLWKGRLPSCALSALERAILAHERGEEDVPGSLIPMLYQQFLMNGDARSMRQVFYHNLEDILSMTFLAERICRHFADPLDGEDGDLHGADLLALGQVHEQMGRAQQAERALRRALPRLDGTERAEVYWNLGLLLKRQERWAEAAEIWQEWITTIPGPDVRPYEELAKYCEWQIADLDQALMWTGWALHNQQTAAGWQRSRQTIDALTHRLDRLKAKVAGQTTDHISET